MKPYDSDPVLLQYLFWFYSHPAVSMTLSLILSGGGAWFYRRRQSI